MGNNQLSVQKSFNFQSVLSELPKNIMIVDSFTKAHSLICSGKYNKILCSVSGGSDSDLIVDIMTKLDVNNIVQYVYIDTGLEYTATKEHITYLENKYGINILRIKPKCPVPLACKKAGQPFISKQVSEYIYRLQSHNFKWEDKSYDELIEEYPDCSSALKWWCNYKSDENKGDSMFNISRNKWLKEFMIENPPTFSISPKCCNLAKKQPAHSIMNDYELSVIGVRKAEGGARAGHNNCISFGKFDTYRPIFWYDKTDKEEYETYADIKHSRCYTEYGLKRTGCAGCPFGRDFEYELEILKEHEPNLYKAVCNIFKESYEYTRRYKEFCRIKDAEFKKSQYGYQMTIFDL